jgi:hypothetical protein
MGFQLPPSAAAAHRSTVFVISPYTNSGPVVHTLSQKLMKT